MSRAKIIVVALLVVLLVIVALQNTAPATTNLLFWDLEVSLALLLFVAFLSGAALGLVLALAGGRKRS